MNAKSTEDKISAIVEHVFDLQALVRGAKITGEHLASDPNIGRLGLEFQAVMAIISHIEEKFETLTAQLGFETE